MPPVSSARSAPFDAACEEHGGKALAHKRAYEFPDPRSAAVAADALGFRVSVPDAKRRARLSFDRMRRLVISIQYNSDDEGLDKWVVDEAWRYLVLGRLKEDSSPTTIDYDNMIRVVEKETSIVGLYLRGRQGWGQRSESSIRRVLKSYGHSGESADQVIGTLHRNAWQLVSRPFEAEELPERRWNMRAPQLRHEGSPGEHPHWDMVLNHIGSELDGELYGRWAEANQIYCGGDYLRAYISLMIRQPFEPLPYLFLWGDENCGKSIFHESIAECLFTRGVVLADRALTNKNDFNGELLGCVLAVVEEKDIAKTPGAFAKIKDTTTARTLSIRSMFRESIQVENCVHWVQCSNSLESCPIYWSDTRILCLKVPKLEKAKAIAKRDLMPLLQQEAPAFIHRLMNLPLPSVEGRLGLPVIDTESKRKAAHHNTPELIDAIYDLMGSRTTWTGTVAELIGSLEPGNWPTDLRALMGQLDAHRGYLKLLGIGYAKGSRTNKGWTLTLTRK